MHKYDSNTKYKVIDTIGGFDLYVLYSRYQAFPEGEALISSCKSHLMSVAYELAEKKGQEIKKINEQRIKVSVGRNELTGISSCGSSTKVELITK